mgnify:CR=1 FL=1
MAHLAEHKNTEAVRTLETRILDAVWDDNEPKIKSLMIEAEFLYKQEELTAKQYNFLTDIETIKEIYS